MKIGILGSGMVGKTLAAGFSKLNHDVKIGTSNPSKLQDWLTKQSGKVEVVSFNDAALHGDVLVVALKGYAALDVLKSISTGALSGKTIIDATNPIDDKAGPENGVLKFFTKPDESLLEILQNEIPAANFVKAYNSVGASHMVNPQFAGGKPTMFIAGNNASAKAVVTKINEDFGWETEDLGSAVSARPIEQLCILWCIPGFLNNQWSHAFKLLK